VRLRAWLLAILFSRTSLDSGIVQNAGINPMNNKISELTDHELDVIIGYHQRKLSILRMDSADRDFEPAYGETETMLRISVLNKEKERRDE